jgi:dipeptidyl aminopeptidase/acylaminoacyl peptidase
LHEQQSEQSGAKRLSLAVALEWGYHPAGGIVSMSRSGSAVSRLLVVVIFITLMPGGFGLQAAPAPASQPAATSTSGSERTLKDKIVFVRVDPSMGMVAMRNITDVDSRAGGVTGTHAAPEMNTMASGNARKDEIELMNPDGSSVTALHVFGSDPMISPDGSKIAYCSQRERIYSQIYVMNVDGTGAKRVTNVTTGDACGPAWSHDGKKIAYYAFALTQPSRNPEIWVMDADGSNPKRLVDHGLDPSWSRDDRQVAFASRRDGIFQIYVMNADGSNVWRLTKHNAEDSNPAWAPDGRSIAYISATGDDRRGLFLMAPDGSDPHGLAHSKHQDFCFPSWSPDGRTIVFSALTRLGSQGIVVGEEKPRCQQWSGEYQIFAMDADGKLHQVSDAKLMGMHPSYGRAVTAP